MIQQLRCWIPSSSSENHLQFCAFLVGNILVSFLEGNMCLHRISIYTSVILRWFLCRCGDSIISDRGAGMHVCQQWKCNTMKIVVQSKSKVQTTFRYHIMFTSFDQKCVNPRNHRPILQVQMWDLQLSCESWFSHSLGHPLLGIAQKSSPHWGILQKYLNSWSYIWWTKALDWLDRLRFCKKMGLLVTQLPDVFSHRICFNCLHPSPQFQLANHSKWSNLSKFFKWHGGHLEEEILPNLESSSWLKNTYPRSPVRPLLHQRLLHVRPPAADFPEDPSEPEKLKIEKPFFASKGEEIKKKAKKPVAKILGTKLNRKFLLPLKNGCFNMFSSWKKKLPLVGPPTQIGSACERTLMMIPIICPMIATSRRTFERVGTKQGGLFGKINFVYNNGVDISKHKCFAKLGSLVIYNKTEDDNQYIVKVSFGGAHGPKTHFFQVNSSSWRHVICWRKRSCVCPFVNGRFFTHFSNRNPVMKRSDVFPVVWYHTINIYNYNPWMSWKARVMSCHVMSVILGKPHRNLREKYHLLFGNIGKHDLRRITTWTSKNTYIIHI